MEDTPLPFTSELLARNALARLEENVDLTELVVCSIPYGDLVHNGTGKVYLGVSSYAHRHVPYAFCGAAKGLKWALAEVDNLRAELEDIKCQATETSKPSTAPSVPPAAT